MSGSTKKLLYMSIAFALWFYACKSADQKNEDLMQLLGTLEKEEDLTADSTFNQILVIKNTAEELKNYTALAKCSFLLAYTQILKGHPYNSVNYLEESKAYASISKDTSLLISTNQFLGSVYAENVEKSKTHYAQMYELAKSSHNIQKETLAEILLANVYMQIEDFANARKLYSEALKKAELNKFTDLYESAFFNIAIIQKKTGEYELAEKTLSHYAYDSNGEKKVDALSHLSELFYIQKNYEKSLSYANQTLKYVSENNLELQKIIYELKYKNYLEIGSLDEAFSNYQKFNEIKLSEDSLKNSQIQQLSNSKYENILNQLEILKLNEQSQKRKNTLIILTILILMATAGLIIFLKLNQKLKTQNSIIQEQNLTIKHNNDHLIKQVKSRTEELLKANESLIVKNLQISTAMADGQSIERKRIASDLHDNLGNTLAALKLQIASLKDQKDYTGSERINQIYTSISKAYKDLRSISHNIYPAELENNGLVAALRKLIRNVNKTDTIQFQEDISVLEKLQFDKKTTLELYACCLELITNIIKHSNGKNASIIAYLEDRKLVMCTQDDGQSSTFNSSTEGKGLVSVRERLSKISGSLTVETSPHFVSKIILSNLQTLP